MMLRFTVEGAWMFLPGVSAISIMRQFQAGPMRPANPHPSFPKLIKLPWQKLHGLGTVVPVAAAGTI